MNLPIQITRPLVVSLAAIAVTAVVVLTQLAPLAAAVITPGAPEQDQTLRAIQAELERHEAEHKTHADRVKGRFIFYPPPPPPRPPTVVRTHDPGPVGPPPPPPPPSTYGGPLTALFPYGDAVWFKEGRVLKIGEEHSGVKVVAIDAPWSVTLRWKEIEWTIDFFKSFKTPKDLLAAGPASMVSGSTPGVTTVPMPGQENGTALNGRPQAPLIEPLPQPEPQPEPQPQVEPEPQVEPAPEPEPDPQQDPPPPPEPDPEES
jgi:hypothetical protein